MSREEELVKTLQQMQLEKEKNKGENNGFNLDEAQTRHKNMFEVKKDLPNWNTFSRSVLRTLESMGFVKHEGNGRYIFTSTIKWRPDSSPADSSGSASDGGRPPVRPGEPSGNGQDGDGTGYREVLSHPLLLSYPKKDFDHLVNQIGDRS